MGSVIQHPRQRLWIIIYIYKHKHAMVLSRDNSPRLMRALVFRCLLPLLIAMMAVVLLLLLGVLVARLVSMTAELIRCDGIISPVEASRVDRSVGWLLR